jgi:predicted DCC family thiol-disulfide oxidoreductase YuxK
MNGLNSGAEGMRRPADVNKPEDHLLHPIVLFDGHCPLCVGSVQFVLRRDRAARFRFASLDSDAAHRVLSGCEARVEELRAVRGGESLGLVQGGHLHTRSDAALRIAAALPLPWRLLSALRLVPRAVRDAAYSAVAARRHRTREAAESCYAPDDAYAERFL